METLTEFSIPNGTVTEHYSVERDADVGVIIYAATDNGPRESFYIADNAARPIALALLRSADPPIHDKGQNVLQFPDFHSAALAVSGVRFSP